jgi:hypothetical protein
MNGSRPTIRSGGRIVRRWSKRRMDFYKALYDENLEYERTLAYRGIDPADDEAIEELRQNILSFDDPAP